VQGGPRPSQAAWEPGQGGLRSCQRAHSFAKNRGTIHRIAQKFQCARNWSTAGHEKSDRSAGKASREKMPAGIQLTAGAGTVGRGRSRPAVKRSANRVEKRRLQNAPPGKDGAKARTRDLGRAATAGRGQTALRARRAAERESTRAQHRGDTASRAQPRDLWHTNAGRPANELDNVYSSVAPRPRLGAKRFANLRRSFGLACSAVADRAEIVPCAVVRLTTCAMRFIVVQKPGCGSTAAISP